MNLDREELRAAHYCAVDTVSRRRLRGEPIPQWLRRHHDRIEAAMSQPGHESQRDQPESDPDNLIGAAAAAAILGLSKRQVTRIAADLDGQIISGRWLFNRNTVQQYQEAMKT